MAVKTVDAVAGATKEFFSWLKQWSQGKEKRNLKYAAKSARLYIKRAEKLFPNAKDDKYLQKYKKRFEEKVI